MGGYCRGELYGGDGGGKFALWLVVFTIGVGGDMGTRRDPVTSDK